MGEKMDLPKVLFYLSGAQLANTNAWYVIAIPFFYLFFWLAFRFCKREGTAITVVALGLLGYMMIGTVTDHNNWWMRGEWWYNTALVFLLGILFAKYEKTLTERAKKGYWIWLVLALVGMFAWFRLSSHLADDLGWYYGENWRDPLKVLHRWICALTQNMASFSYVCFLFLAMMKIRIGNKLLGLLGGLTLEIYLIHGMFVEMFGYDFSEVTKSITYIKNVGLYVLVVAACTVAGTWIFHILYRNVMKAINPRKKQDKLPNPPAEPANALTEQDA